MRITFASTPICTLSGRGTDSPETMTIDGQCSEQTAKFLRAQSAKVFNRGNEITTISFKVFRSHGSIQAAEAFALSHRKSLYGKYGNLVLIADDGSGMNTATSTLTNSVCKQCKVTYKGMNSWTEYNFIGGAFS